MNRKPLRSVNKTADNGPSRPRSAPPDLPRDHALSIAGVAISTQPRSNIPRKLPIPSGLNPTVTKCRKLTHTHVISVLSPIHEIPASDRGGSNCDKENIDPGAYRKKRRTRRSLPAIPTCLDFAEDAYGRPGSPSTKDDILVPHSTDIDDELYQLQTQHWTMDTILSDRKLKLLAAKSELRQYGLRGLVGYLVKIRDTAVLVDLLPVVQTILEDTCSQLVHVAEIVPEIKGLLSSKYETYVSRCLDLLIAIFRRRKLSAKESRLVLTDLGMYLNTCTTIIRGLQFSSSKLTTKANRYMVLVEETSK